MSVNSGTRVFEGGTAGHGTTALNHTWQFAEGVTGFFRTYLLVGNPNATAGRVGIRYQLADGTIFTKGHNLPGLARLTIDMNSDDPRLASTPFAFVMGSDLPIVAERSIWWGLPFFEGSTALGHAVPFDFEIVGTSWAVGEAAEGGPDGDATFVLIDNRSLNRGRVLVTVVYDDETHEQKEYTLPSDNRMTVRIGEGFPRTWGQRFSVLVESLDYVPLTVECARYQSQGGFLSGGGVTSTTRIK